MSNRGDGVEQLRIRRDEIKAELVKVFKEAKEKFKSERGRAA